MDQTKIHFIITGGTIDSEWVGAKDGIQVRDNSILPVYIENLAKNLKFYDQLRFSQIFMKDSRDINYGDREKILKTVSESTEDKIIITHGTYSIPETARFIEDNLKSKSKTIIITGGWFHSVLNIQTARLI